MSPRRRLSTGFIHEYLERNKSPSKADGSSSTPLPVRLPQSHSQKYEEAAQFDRAKLEQPSEEMLQILPNICSCLFGLCGCGCGLDLCTIIPKLCSFLAGLCGSLNNSGISSGQNYTPMTVQVLLASNIQTYEYESRLSFDYFENIPLAKRIFRTFKIVDQKRLL